jgi:SAM-dependent methyltransferase
MSWRKYLLVPGLVVKGFGPAPRPRAAWEGFWRAVRRTGPEGDVLWDGAGEAELAWWRATARAHLDPSLPLVDVGCGNGRLSRMFAATFPSVLGVDLAAAAVEVARRESAGTPSLQFRQLDVTAPEAADALLAAVGPANVVVRGVFHVLSPADRRRAADTIDRVLAGRGSLLLLETNWRGDALGYLEHLGGRSGRLPAALGRLIEAGVPRPAAFGPRELADAFPASGWVTVAEGPVEIAPVRTLGPDAASTIPGYHAVLRTAPAAAARGPRTGAADQGM